MNGEAFAYGFESELIEMIEKDAGLKKILATGALAGGLTLGGMLGGAHPSVTPHVRSAGGKIVHVLKKGARGAGKFLQRVGGESEAPPPAKTSPPPAPKKKTEPPPPKKAEPPAPKKPSLYEEAVARHGSAVKASRAQK